jgi:hypothetical protein
MRPPRDYSRRRRGRTLSAASAASPSASAPPPPPRRPKLLVSTPPDRTIHAPVGEITQAIDARLQAVGASPQRRALFARAARLVAAAVALSHADLRRRLQSRYLPYYAAANRQPLFAARPPTDAELDAGELTFVRQLVDALLSARYSPLSRAQERAALDASFRLSVPVRVDLGRLESSLLARFWRSGPELQALRRRLPRTADRVLVFHRGVGVARARGLFLAEKLDLLARYAVVAPLAALAQFVRLAVLGRLVFLARVLLRSVLRVARRVSPFGSAFVAESAAERAVQARVGIGATPTDAVWGGGTASVASSSGSSSSSGSDGERGDDETDDDEEEEDDDEDAPWFQMFDESSSTSSDEEEEGEQDAAKLRGPTGAHGSTATSSINGGSALSSIEEERDNYRRWRLRQRRRRRRALRQWANTSVSDQAVAPAALHDGRHVVERRTLAHVLPTAGDVLRSLFKVVELQEPAFGEVVVVFREKEEGGGKGAEQQQQQRQEEEEPLNAAAAAPAPAAPATAPAPAEASTPSPPRPPLSALLDPRRRRQLQDLPTIGQEAVARAGEADVVAALAISSTVPRDGSPGGGSTTKPPWQELAQQAQQAQTNVAGAVAQVAAAAQEAAQVAASAATAAAEAAVSESDPRAVAQSAFLGLAQGVLGGGVEDGGVTEEVESAGLRQRMSPEQLQRGSPQQQKSPSPPLATPGVAAAQQAASSASSAAAAVDAAASAAAAAVLATAAAAGVAAATASPSSPVPPPPPLPPPPPPKPVPYSRNIYLRRYRDVPLADLELTVPFVELGVRPAQALRLAAATLGAVVAALAAYAEGHREALAQAAAAAVAAAASSSSSAAPPPRPPASSLLPLLWAAVAGMIGAALQARDEVSNERSAALATLLELQSGKCSESQGAVLGVVSEALAESTLKETLLAFGVLLLAAEEDKAGGEGASLLSANDVSHRAQRLLSEDLGVHGAVYSSRAVLPALERAGLVVRRPASASAAAAARPLSPSSSSSSSTRPRSFSSSPSSPPPDLYEVVPLEQAVRTLESDWATAHERVDLSLASLSSSSGSDDEAAVGGVGGGYGSLLETSPWLRHASATSPSPSPPPMPPSFDSRPSAAAAAVAVAMRRTRVVLAPRRLAATAAAARPRLATLAVGRGV